MTNNGAGSADTSSGSSSLEATLKDLERIARETNPILRNLLITQRYHDLSHSLASAIGSGNANWSTFASWASKTAGQSIRGEGVPEEVARLLADEAAFDARVAELTRAVPFLHFLYIDLDMFDVARAIVEEVSAQISEGNLKVFAELGPLFARFTALFSGPGLPSDVGVDAFVRDLRPGAANDGGQDSLKLAFRAYADASVSADPKRRAELTLYGNVLIGLHEQTRLQPNIQGGIDAPVSPKVYRALRSGTTSFLAPLIHLVLGRRLKKFHEDVRVAWERIATRFFMRLALPGGSSISLGEDVPVGTTPFPAHLDPLALAEVIALVRTYDSELDSLRGSGAGNWTVLENRMAFIADLFRSRQQQADLFTEPFEPGQRAAIEAGKVPPGPL